MRVQDIYKVCTCGLYFLEDIRSILSTLGNSLTGYQTSLHAFILTFLATNQDMHKSATLAGETKTILPYNFSRSEF